MKGLVAFLLLVMMVGCTQLLPVNSHFTRLEPVLVPEPEAFSQALGQLTDAQNLSGLKEFQQLYPNSPWSAHAATIVLYVDELNQRKLQLEDFRNKQQQLQVDNQQLTGKIEQLKKLLIELEQRPQ